MWAAAKICKKLYKVGKIFAFAFAGNQRQPGSDLDFDLGIIGWLAPRPPSLLSALCHPSIYHLPHTHGASFVVSIRWPVWGSTSARRGGLVLTWPCSHTHYQRSPQAKRERHCQNEKPKSFAWVSLKGLSPLNARSSMALFVGRWELFVFFFFLLLLLKLHMNLIDNEFFLIIFLCFFVCFLIVLFAFFYLILISNIKFVVFPYFLFYNFCFYINRWPAPRFPHRNGVRCCSCHILLLLFCCCFIVIFLLCRSWVVCFCFCCCYRCCLLMLLRPGVRPFVPFSPLSAPSAHTHITS